MNDLWPSLDTKLELPEVEANSRPAKSEYVKEAWEEILKSRRLGSGRESTRWVAARRPHTFRHHRLRAHSYQDGVPFLVRNFGEFGIHLNYTLDFGKRSATVRELPRNLPKRSNISSTSKKKSL